MIKPEQAEKWLEIAQVAGGWMAALIAVAGLAKLWLDYRALVRERAKESEATMKNFLDFAMKSTEVMQQQIASNNALKESVTALTHELRMGFGLMRERER